MKQWKALLVRNEELKRTEKQNPGSRTAARAMAQTAPFLVFFFLLLSDSFSHFQPKRCTKIWHNKQRENETIPIWNFNCRSCKEFWKPAIPFQWNALGKKLGKAHIVVTQIFPKTQLTYLSQSVVKFHSVIFELFLGIINTWKNPRIWSPWIFVENMAVEQTYEK